MKREDYVIESVAVGATIIMMVVTFLEGNVYNIFFGDSFLWNLLGVPLWIFACFFVGGIIIGLPSLIANYILYKFSNSMWDLSDKTRRTIIIISAIVLCVILAVVFTAANS